ncbi:MAG: hypothetical protein ACPGVZ_08285 [Myxococcota bacterium]
MGRFRIGLGCVLPLIAFAWTAAAGDYRSGFGFGITVPDVYLVLTAEEVARKADLFLSEDAEASYGGIPSGLRHEVFQRVQSGEIEIFYRTEGVDFDFVDNVNVMVQRALIPNSESQLDEVCRVLPGEFSRLFGRPISLDDCELRAVAGRRSLYLAFDGALVGTKTLQYQVQRGNGQTLILTATSKVAHVPRMLSEFEAMVASIRPD